MLIDPLFKKFVTKHYKLNDNNAEKTKKHLIHWLYKPNLKAIDQVLSQLTKSTTTKNAAKYFKPKPGEKPDDKGLFWRNIMGVDTPFNNGEDMTDKLKGRADKLSKNKKTKVTPDKIINELKTKWKKEIAKPGWKPYIREQIQEELDKITYPFDKSMITTMGDKYKNQMQKDFIKIQKKYNVKPGDLKSHTPKIGKLSQNELTQVLDYIKESEKRDHTIRGSGGFLLATGEFINIVDNDGSTHEDVLHEYSREYFEEKFPDDPDYAERISRTDLTEYIRNTDMLRIRLFHHQLVIQGSGIPTSSQISAIRNFVIHEEFPINNVVGEFDDKEYQERFNNFLKFRFEGSAAAKKFKPKPGEKPDEKGLFWRNIMGKDTPFSNGEDMTDKLKGRIKQIREKNQPRITEVIRRNNKRKQKEYNDLSDEEVQYDDPQSDARLHRDVEKAKKQKGEVMSYLSEENVDEEGNSAALFFEDADSIAHQSYNYWSKIYPHVNFHTALSEDYEDISSGLMGQFSQPKNTVSIFLDNMDDSQILSTITHEVAHAQWNLYTPEQREKFFDLVDDMPDLSLYSRSYKDSYRSIRFNNEQEIKRIRDGILHRPKIPFKAERQLQDDIAELEDEIDIARLLFANEYHSAYQTRKRGLKIEGDGAVTRTLLKKIDEELAKILGGKDKGMPFDKKAEGIDTPDDVYPAAVSKNNKSAEIRKLARKSFEYSMKYRGFLIVNFGINNNPNKKKTTAKSASTLSCACSNDNPKHKHYHGSIPTEPTHLERYKGRKGFFIKKFLISDSLNLNKWKVTYPAIQKDIKSFIGQPVVITPAGDHPPTEHQDRFAVGKIIDVGIDKLTRTAWAVEEITDKKVQKAIKEKKVQFGSPTVQSPYEYVEYQNRHTASEMTILHRFIGKHDALVIEPAYGKMKDVIKAVCEGDGIGCASKLVQVQASVTARKLTTSFTQNVKILNERLRTLERSASTKFKPKPGEKPDKNGLYWRYIMGHDVPFKSGEDMTEKVKNAENNIKKKSPTKKKKTVSTKKETTKPKKKKTKKKEKKLSKEEEFEEQEYKRGEKIINTLRTDYAQRSVTDDGSANAYITSLNEVQSEELKTIWNENFNDDDAPLHARNISKENFNAINVILEDILGEDRFTYDYIQKSYTENWEFNVAMKNLLEDKQGRLGLSDTFGGMFTKYKDDMIQRQSDLDNFGKARVELATKVKRGTDLAEIVTLQETGLLGGGGGEYDFVSFTVNNDIAKQFAGQKGKTPVIIEIPKEKLKEHMIIQKYDYDLEANYDPEYEEIDDPHSTAFASEEEVRTNTDKIQIKGLGAKFYLLNGLHNEKQQEKIKKDFADIGEVVFVDDFNNLK